MATSLGPFNVTVGLVGSFGGFSGNLSKKLFFMIVIAAPLSTSAFTVMPFAFTSTYGSESLEAVKW